MPNPRLYEGEEYSSALSQGLRDEDNIEQDKHNGSISRFVFQKHKVPNNVPPPIRPPPPKSSIPKFTAQEPDWSRVTNFKDQGVTYIDHHHNSNIFNLDMVPQQQQQQQQQREPEWSAVQNYKDQGQTYLRFSQHPNNAQTDPSRVSLVEAQPIGMVLNYERATSPEELEDLRIVIQELYARLAEQDHLVRSLKESLDSFRDKKGIGAAKKMARSTKFLLLAIFLLLVTMVMGVVLSVSLGSAGSSAKDVIFDPTEAPTLSVFSPTEIPTPAINEIDHNSTNAASTSNLEELEGSDGHLQANHPSFPVASLPPSLDDDDPVDSTNVSESLLPTLAPTSEYNGIMSPSLAPSLSADDWQGFVKEEEDDQTKGGLLWLGVLLCIGSAILLIAITLRHYYFKSKSQPSLKNVSKCSILNNQNDSQRELAISGEDPTSSWATNDPETGEITVPTQNLKRKQRRLGKRDAVVPADQARGAVDEAELLRAEMNKPKQQVVEREAAARELMEMVQSCQNDAT